MIFKTFDKDSDKILSKIGLLGKSFEQIGASIRQRKIEIDSLMGAMSKKDAKAEVGGFWSYVFGNKSIKEKPIDLTKFVDLDNSKASNLLKSLQEIEVASKTNTSVWQEYFSTLSDGQKWQIEFVKNNNLQKASTDDLVKANQQARASALAYNETIKQSTLAFKAASIAKRIFATIGNMAAMWALSKVIGVVTDTIGELVHSEENLRQSASELGSELSNNSSDIEGYKKKIEELKAVINDSSSSFDEVSQARVDLMAVQDELIEKFGTEKGVIESITSAINDQTDALDELNRRAYFQKKNEFNEKTGGDKFADWLSFGNTDDDRVQSNMDKMVSSMRYSFYELETTGNEVLDNLIAKSYGLNIAEDMYGDGKHFQVYGTLDEIQDKLYGIQELSQGFDSTTSFENSFTTISNDVDDALAKFKNLYDQYVLYEKILTDNPDNQYDEQFDLINKAKEAYNEAVKSGNEENLKTSADEYAKTLQSAIDLAMGNYDYDVADYFKAMYPELQQMFGEWQFSLNFEPNTDGLQDKVADALDSIDGVSDGTTSFSVEDIENFNPNVATQEQIDAYGELTNVAETYGLTVKQLIALLQTMGLIQSESYQQLVDTFGQDNVNKLSPEDLEIAYTIKNVGNMTFEQLQTEIEKTKQQTNETGVSPLSISQTIDQLNTQLKPAFDSLQSAYQDIFTDDGKFALNSIDILSTCDTIKSKLDEMSDPEGLNLDVDYSAFEDFVRVLNNTESTEQDVENAFDSLATSITQAALTGAEDFETMKDALEDLGVVNNEMVAFQALASNTEMLEQALSEANASMDDFIVNTEDGSVEATNAGRAFLEEKVGAENCAEALNILAFHKELCNLQEMNTAGEVANLKTLAENAGYTGEVIQYLTEMEQIYQEVASGTLTPTQIGFKLARAVALKAMIEGAASQVQYAPKVDWSGAVKDAGKAGKDSGKSYKDKLKEQLSDLEGVISGVTGRIDDQISSINEQKSAALDSIDAQKEAIESAKESAVEALEAERDARLEVIETQKAQLEEQIKLIDKQIKQKQDEIDAINEAAEARKRELDLQKAQYELERMQNQRTILQYSENKGMHYVNDSKGIRDAKEKVDDAKRQIEIANIQKEIDLLEDQKDLLNEQIDLLDEQADAVNKYYDEQIKQTEKYYDSLIKNLEKQRKETEAYYESLTKSLEQRKDKFQELTEILEKAELSAKLKQLGIDEEALLNGSEEEFNKLKDAYMNIVFQLNEGNDEVLNKLRELSGYEGTAPAMFEESNTKLGTMNDELGTANTEVGNVNSSLTETASTTSDVATNVSDVNTNIGETVGLVNDEKGAFDDLKQTIDLIVEAINQKIQAIETGQSTVASAVGSEMANFQLLINKILEVKEKLDEVNNTVTTMERQPVDNLANAFQLLYDKLLLVSNLLGVGVEGEGAVNGISGAIQALNEISLEEGIIAQFTNLKTAIDSVTAAISGGGGESSEGEGSGGGSGSSGGKQGSKGGSGSKGGKGSEGESGGGGNSLTGAIKSMGETAKEVIGEPDAEGDGTVIGEFGSMETAVNDVRDAIGTEGSAGGEGGKSGSGGKGESDDTLVGSIEYLGDKTDEEMGESGGDGIIGRFEEFRDVIGEADAHVKSISEGLDDIDGKEVSCTIHVNIETSGGTGFTGSAQVLGSMNLNSATYNAQYQGKAHYEGTAEVTGDWGVKKGGTTLVGELGQELIVFPNGRFKTVGDNGAEFVDIPANSIVFNHLQTKELLSKGNIVGRGRALASGTALANGTSNNADDSIWTTLADGSRIRDLQPGDKMYDMIQKFDAYFKSIDGNLEKLVPNSFYERNREMNQLADQISYVSSVVNNNRNVQQPVTIQVGDIHLTGVQDVNGLAHAIKTRLPNAMLQEMHRR
jgi:chromosome segregation ATPase